MFLQTLQSRHVKASGTLGGYLQNIVKEGLTRKVFWNRDLAGSDCRPGLEVSAALTLRCECARVHCALSTARVKVIRHMEGEWGCGKCEESVLVPRKTLIIPAVGVFPRYSMLAIGLRA